MFAACLNQLLFRHTFIAKAIDRKLRLDFFQGF